MTSPAMVDTSPVYFWSRGGKYGYLCQWYSSDFTAPAPSSSKSQETMTFSSTEQYMMYHKAMAFHDETIAAQIMLLENPWKQKAKGREVRGFNEKKWDTVREKIVEDGNWFKFMAAKDASRGQELRRLLLETGDRLLVEVGVLSNDAVTTH